MDKVNVFTIGTGGHAKVVSEIIESNDSWNIIAFIDDNKRFDTFYGKKVFSSLEEARTFSPSTEHAFVAIGNNSIRKRWQKNLIESGFTLPAFAHPSACLSKGAKLGKGVLICAQVVVGPDTEIGDGAILNSACVVDHDVTVGDFVHLSQGVLACGGCTIGANSLIGPGSVIEKMARVEDDTIVQSLQCVANKSVNLRT